MVWTFESFVAVAFQIVNLSSCSFYISPHLLVSRCSDREEARRMKPEMGSDATLCFGFFDQLIFILHLRIIQKPSSRKKIRVCLGLQLLRLIMHPNPILAYSHAGKFRTLNRRVQFQILNYLEQFRSLNSPAHWVLNENRHSFNITGTITGRDDWSGVISPFRKMSKSSLLKWQSQSTWNHCRRIIYKSLIAKLISLFRKPRSALYTGAMWHRKWQKK